MALIPPVNIHDWKGHSYLHSSFIQLVICQHLYIYTISGCRHISQHERTTEGKILAASKSQFTKFKLQLAWLSVTATSAPRPD